MKIVTHHSHVISNGPKTLVTISYRLQQSDIQLQREV